MKNYLKNLTWSIEVPVNESFLPLNQVAEKYDENEPFFVVKKK